MVRVSSLCSLGPALLLFNHRRRNVKGKLKTGKAGWSVAVVAARDGHRYGFEIQVCEIWARLGVQGQDMLRSGNMPRRFERIARRSGLLQMERSRRLFHVLADRSQGGTRVR